jgi:hypothetical protein|tara:strand:- start:210 stop:869 length:660 start_codon:yes stop_codon:yes gene_type:complete
MLQQNVNNPKKEKSFYRYGVQYSSHIPDTTGTAKPNLNAMIANHGAFGNPTPNEKAIKTINEIVKKQQKEEAERIKLARRSALVQRLISFRKTKTILSYLPTKVTTFLQNMPTLSPKNIYKYLRAEVSNIEQGPVSLPVYEERKKICGDCPKRMFPEGYSDPLGFCTECGCGANPRAQLTIKLKLPATSCPLGKWDEAPGIYEGLWGRIRYIFTRRRSK